jgi:hypothetical protein
MGDASCAGPSSAFFSRMRAFSNLAAAFKLHSAWLTPRQPSPSSRWSRCQAVPARSGDQSAHTGRLRARPAAASACLRLVGRPIPARRGRGRRPREPHPAPSHRPPPERGQAAAAAAPVAHADPRARRPAAPARRSSRAARGRASPCCSPAPPREPGRDRRRAVRARPRPPLELQAGDEPLHGGRQARPALTLRWRHRLPFSRAARENRLAGGRRLRNSRSNPIPLRALAGTSWAPRSTPTVGLPPPWVRATDILSGVKGGAEGRGFESSRSR